MNQGTTLNNDNQYVGILRRLGAFAYDFILLLAVLFLMTAILMPVSRGFISPANIFFKIYILLTIFIFFGWFWVHGGQTLGMRAWKIRVELEDGHNLGWSQALLRFILAVLTFGAGLLWCLWDAKYRALYDVLAKTHVIRVDKGYVPPPG